MPFLGAVKGSLKGPEEGMGVVDIDMKILEVAESNYKVRADLKRDDWHYGYSHLKAQGETNGVRPGALRLPTDRQRPETAHKDENAAWDKEISKLPREQPLTQP
jgi:hypothetical protein